ncbi:unnamed protein product [Fraxinus pennsylvanica]|uniref:Uncharacterized protein n=1 Tax=Fraxinus pennsylvanica TaxID=56036 RepID=A0AAD1YNH1_9LAMI|nr:unnamed protein product [Fraxinus pennsylvanica]
MLSCVFLRGAAPENIPITDLKAPDISSGISPPSALPPILIPGWLGASGSPSCSGLVAILVNMLVISSGRPSILNGMDVNGGGGQDPSTHLLIRENSHSLNPAHEKGSRKFLSD